MVCLARKPTQEEKITVLEENLTILLGITSGQERDIKSIQVGVMSLDRRFDALEGRLYGMDHRLSTLEKRFDTLEQSVNSRSPDAAQACRQPYCSRTICRGRRSGMAEATIGALSWNGSYKPKRACK